MHRTFLCAFHGLNNKKGRAGKLLEMGQEIRCIFMDDMILSFVWSGGERWGGGAARKEITMKKNASVVLATTVNSP